MQELFSKCVIRWEKNGRDSSQLHQLFSHSTMRSSNKRTMRFLSQRTTNKNDTGEQALVWEGAKHQFQRTETHGTIDTSIFNDTMSWVQNWFCTWMDFHLHKEMRRHCVSSLGLAVLKYTQPITAATMYSGPNVYIRISAALAYHFENMLLLSQLWEDSM